MKSYKNIPYYLIISIIFLNGCKEVLNEHPYSSVNTDSFYQNKKQANLALNGVYNAMWKKWESGVVFRNEFPGDALQHYPHKDQYDTFSWVTSESRLSIVWTQSYIAINRANTLLGRLSDTDINTDSKAKIRGQAKFLRALFYYHLVTEFGGVPIYTRGTTDLSEVDKKRGTIKEVYSQIKADLQDAAKSLSPYNKSTHAAGRATSGAAKALLSMVYIQQKEWKKAANEAKEVIDMDVFGLFKDYADIFDPAHANEKEQIFSLQHGNGGDPTTNYGITLINRIGPPATTLPDGTNAVFYHRALNVSIKVSQPFFNSTPNTYRKWMTMREKMPFYYKSGTNTLVSDTVRLSSPFIIKYYRMDFSTGHVKTGIRFPIIRYSNILLIYAEALNELNESPPQAAYNALNKVRERARGIGTSHEQPENIYPRLSGLTKDRFRDSVLIEEKREFISEGKLRLELLRHNRFIKSAQQQGYSVADSRKLYPIPSEEVSRNSNLKQNPGY